MYTTVCTYYSFQMTVNPTRTTYSHLKRIINTNCCTHTVVPPDDGPRYVRNMQRLMKYTGNKLCIKLVFLYTREDVIDTAADAGNQAQCLFLNINQYMSNTTILMYTRLHVLTFLNGHHQDFQRIESTDAVYTLGSQYVYIDKIRKIYQFSQIRSGVCIAQPSYLTDFIDLTYFINVDILGSQRLHSFC